MPIPQIGVDVDDFRLPTKESLQKAAELQFRAVEFATVAGELAPQNLTSSGRRHLSRHAEGLGLHIVSLVADFPGLRFTDPRTVHERVERTCQVLELAADLKVAVVTASLGAVTHPDTGEFSPLAIEGLRRLGEFADSRGRILALRPSRDADERLAEILREVGCPCVAVGLDPAALVMAGANPLATVERLAGRIALVHARDGTVGRDDHAGQETRLGEGDVDFSGLTVVLDAAEFSGAYILRRTSSQTPITDLRHGRDVLARLLG